MNGNDQHGHQIIRRPRIFHKLTGCQPEPRVRVENEIVQFIVLGPKLVSTTGLMLLQLQLLPFLLNII